MGKIAVSEPECFLPAVNAGAAGKMRPHPVSVLVPGQDFVYGYGDEFPGFIAEPEPHGRNCSVGIGTGNHLYRNINAQYAFHSQHPSSLFGVLYHNI